ncbi:hypothetical protein [Duganella sp. BuS-21]|uniref:hypothetical protein n=1 Tax=Duganella sp. BuS-21 TaxID=2943848 RepID=UPI0035A64ED2
MITVILRLPIFLIFIGILVACVPMRHVEHLRPAVSGLIVEDKKPIPGVVLFLAKFPGKNQPCAEVGEVVPVSSAGIFSLAAVQEDKLTDSLINPAAVRGQLTVLCIRHPKKGVLIGVSMMMKLNNPVTLHLVCDVARPHSGGIGPHTVSTMLGQLQYCEATTN